MASPLSSYCYVAKSWYALVVSFPSKGEAQLDFQLWVVVELQCIFIDHELRLHWKTVASGPEFANSLILWVHSFELFHFTEWVINFVNSDTTIKFRIYFFVENR